MSCSSLGLFWLVATAHLGRLGEGGLGQLLPLWAWLPPLTGEARAAAGQPTSHLPSFSPLTGQPPRAACELPGSWCFWPPSPCGWVFGPSLGFSSRAWGLAFARGRERPWARPPTRLRDQATPHALALRLVLGLAQAQAWLLAQSSWVCAPGWDSAQPCPSPGLRPGHFALGFELASLWPRHALGQAWPWPLAPSPHALAPGLGHSPWIEGAQALGPRLCPCSWLLPKPPRLARDQATPWSSHARHHASWESHSLHLGSAHAPATWLFHPAIPRQALAQPPRPLPFPLYPLTRLLLTCQLSKPGENPVSPGRKVEQTFKHQLAQER